MLTRLALDDELVTRERVKHSNTLAVGRALLSASLDTIEPSFVLDRHTADCKTVFKARIIFSVR